MSSLLLTTKPTAPPTTASVAFQTNQGRVYPCGKAVNDLQSSLLDHLCTFKSQTFAMKAWDRRIQRGNIHIQIPGSNGAVPCTDPGHLLLLHTLIFYHRPPWNEPVVEPVVESGLELEDSLRGAKKPRVPFNVLFSDKDLIAINKPSGIPTMPSQTFAAYTVLHVLRNALTEHTLAPPQPVHRLGVGTSGVLLVATSIEARKSLSKAIRDRNVTKVYRALVSNGTALPDFMNINCPIGPVPYPIGGGTLYAARPDANPTTGETGVKELPAAKPSVSLVRVVRRHIEMDQAVVEVEIPTGRPHQIRIHMAYAGYPLVGDVLYLAGGVPNLNKQSFWKRDPTVEDMDSDEEGEEGGTEEVGGGEGTKGMVRRVALPRDCGYSLHAHRITFEHPTIDGKWMMVEAPPPLNLR
jgi:23S rRNA pseudouridine1911/1915/1917 synthase